jgi:hypothetical protein
VTRWGGGVETSTISMSSSEGRWKGGGATLPPSSPLRTTPSPHQDVFSQPAGSTADEHRLKHSQAEGRPPTGLFGKLLPMQVISDREEGKNPFVCINLKKVSLIPCSKV